MTDKKFYIIARTANVTGIGALIFGLTSHILYAISKGFIPIVDLKHYKNQYFKDGREYKDNSWEYFLEQPLGYSIDDIPDDAGDGMIVVGGGDEPADLFDPLIGIGGSHSHIGGHEHLIIVPVVSGGNKRASREIGMRPQECQRRAFAGIHGQKLIVGQHTGHIRGAGNDAVVPAVSGFQFGAHPVLYVLRGEKHTFIYVFPLLFFRSGEEARLVQRQERSVCLRFRRDIDDSRRRVQLYITAGKSGHDPSDHRIDAPARYRDRVQVLTRPEIIDRRAVDRH